MKKPSKFTPLATGYAAETLINGNISHCKEYLKDLKNNGYLNLWHNELIQIKEQCPERYLYMLK